MNSHCSHASLSSLLLFLRLGASVIFHVMLLSHIQGSNSSVSVDGPSADYAKSYDAVVFDVLKVTPEEFAVSKTVSVQFDAFSGGKLWFYIICPVL